MELNQIIELSKNNIEKLPALIAGIGAIWVGVKKFLESPINNRIDEIESGLSKNEFSEKTIEILKAEKEKLHIFKIFKMYIDREKMDRIIDVVNKSNGDLNLTMSLKSEKYFKVVNGKITENTNRSDKIICTFYIILFIFLLVSMIALIGFNFYIAKEMDLFRLLYLYGMIISLGIVSGILLERPYLYYYSRKVNEYIKKTNLT